MKSSTLIEGGSSSLNIKLHYVKNEAIENMFHYKSIVIELLPFDLRLDGNFCDEFYKYFMDIF